MSSGPDRARARALGPGAVAGLRSMLAPVLLSRAALGEAVADKTPVVPSRASAPVLIQRAALYASRRLDGRFGASRGGGSPVRPGLPAGRPATGASSRPLRGRLRRRSRAAVGARGRWLVSRGCPFWLLANAIPGVTLTVLLNVGPLAL